MVAGGREGGRRFLLNQQPPTHPFTSSHCQAAHATTLNIPVSLQYNVPAAASHHTAKALGELRVVPNSDYHCLRLPLHRPLLIIVYTDGLAHFTFWKKKSITQNYTLISLSRDTPRFLWLRDHHGRQPRSQPIHRRRPSPYPQAHRRVSTRCTTSTTHSTLRSTGGGKISTPHWK
ncbi:hypothetical protein E2C01_015000 [Portunus trituberculatus]|uniref:Uncharacterized protein n=1 Tax=Portunus trituberculatus TaxID=210409 RepID=A0A5B7DLJ3_PORTR|nr:hypothetical protein [Portunus trituberculatus]